MFVFNSGLIELFFLQFEEKEKNEMELIRNMNFIFPFLIFQKDYYSF